MSLATKLQLKPPARVALLGVAAPALDLESCTMLSPDQAEEADAVIAFALRSSDLDGSVAPALSEAADAEKLVWVAYPKAGQLDTDLNRDRLAAAMISRGLRPVRQIAVDEVWSALRFRR
jgi:hypothetical protein